MNRPQDFHQLLVWDQELWVVHFFYVSSTNHGFIKKNMKRMGLVQILKKQGKIYHTKCD